MTCWEIAFGQSGITAPSAESRPALLSSFISFSCLKISQSNLPRSPDSPQKHENRTQMQPGWVSVQWHVAVREHSWHRSTLVCRPVCLPGCLSVVVGERLSKILTLSPDTQPLKRSLKYLTVRQQSTAQQPWNQSLTAEGSVAKQRNSLQWRWWSDELEKRKRRGRTGGGKCEDKRRMEKRGASHECAYVSNHVLLILYPAAHNPSSLKRDSALWNRREGDEELERRRQKERWGGCWSLQQRNPSPFKGGVAPRIHPPFPASQTNSHWILMFPLLLLHHISSALRFTRALTYIGALSSVYNNKLLYEINYKPITLCFRNRKKMMIKTALVLARDEPETWQRSAARINPLFIHHQVPLCCRQTEERCWHTVSQRERAAALCVYKTSPTVCVTVSICWVNSQQHNHILVLISVVIMHVGIYARFISSLLLRHGRIQNNKKLLAADLRKINETGLFIWCFHMP